jgi:hypothetical protein
MEKTEKPLTKLEAVRKLATYDHSFLTPEGARSFAEPFGMKVYTQKVRANMGDAKGLYVEGVAPRTLVEGVDAASLAVDLCNHLGVSYPPMFGRGSRLRACCEALERHVTKEA